MCGCYPYCDSGAESNLNEEEQYFERSADKGSLDGNVWCWICVWKEGASPKTEHPAATFLSWVLCVL